MILNTIYKRTKPYHFLFILLCSILLGTYTGFRLQSKAILLKPLGDIFLNLLFTFVGPLIFFSISSAIAAMKDLTKIGKIFINMLMVFLFTGTIAAIFMLFVVKLYPPAQNIDLHLPFYNKPPSINIFNQIVNVLSVPNFMNLFSRENILALILVSILIGIATAVIGEKGKPFARFLQSGTEVFMKAFSFIMYYAPIGFFAYFAVLVSEIGPKILETYYRATLAYYLSGLIYFLFAFSFYAYLAGKLKGIKLFWKNCLIPSMTALATCSSAASIPANLEATRKTGVPDEILDLVIPLGTIIHKEGSVLGGILKITFLFGIFHMSFTTPGVLFIAIIISLLVGTVMGAIPSGGMVGEMLILSVYGFPPQSLIIIAAISIIIDPLATMLNVTGNMVCSMLVARLSSYYWD